MEVDRTKYMVKSYLRLRLGKIQKFPLHILSSAEYYNRLSKSEYNFVKRYVDLIDKHYKAAVLDKLPEAFREWTTRADDVNMIVEPKLDTFVFCRVNEELGEVQVGGESGADS